MSRPLGSSDSPTREAKMEKALHLVQSSTAASGFIELEVDDMSGLEQLGGKLRQAVAHRSSVSSRLHESSAPASGRRPPVMWLP